MTTKERLNVVFIESQQIILIKFMLDGGVNFFLSLANGQALHRTGFSYHEENDIS
jgi:hypothetical protein